MATAEFPQESRHSSQLNMGRHRWAQVCSRFGAGSDFGPSEQQNLSYKTRWAL